MPNRTIGVCSALAVSFFGQYAAATQVLSPTDEVRLGPSGSKYLLPRAWTASSGAKAVLLSSPEQDARIALISVGEAPDAATAVGKAWRRFKPGVAPRGLDAPTSLPAEDGWDERKAVNFTTSPTDSLALHALALRRGAHWLVLITDTSKSALERHQGAISIIEESLLAPGYRPESLVRRQPHRLDRKRVAQLKDFIANAMTKLGVPGVGYALIEDGRVVAEGGLGVLELGKPSPVTANSLFAIGSNTKGMTTLLLAKLIDEGKLTWDEPVIDVYPRFQLGDADTTRKVLVRHLVCACTGLPRKDLDWMLGTDSRSPGSVTFDLLGATQPTSNFGEEFQYNNLMASAAGFIAAHVLYPELELDAAYDRAMSEKIFEPLGMTATTFDFNKVMTLNHASPHGLDLQGRPAISNAMFVYPAVSPAGLAWSTAHDMAKYVENELSEGRSPDGTMLYSAKNLLQRRVPIVAMGKDQYYGMGIKNFKMGGVTMIRHGGATMGFLSDWYAIPSANIGAVILTNSSQGFLLLDPFARKLLEVIYDGKPEADEEIAAAAEASRIKAASFAEDVQAPPSSDVVKKLAERYVSKELGHIDVQRNEGEVTFNFGAFSSRMAQRKTTAGPDILETVSPAVIPLSFIIVDRGARTMVVRDGQHEYIYKADK